MRYLRMKKEHEKQPNRNVQIKHGREIKIPIEMLEEQF